jgi:hypothetical protein
MACEKSKVATGWVEGKVPVVEDDWDATKANAEAFRLEKRAKFSEFFDGLCEGDCVLKVTDNIAIDPMTITLTSMTVKYLFDFECADPEEGGGK